MLLFFILKNEQCHDSRLVSNQLNNKRNINKYFLSVYKIKKLQIYRFTKNIEIKLKFL